MAMYITCNTSITHINLFFRDLMNSRRLKWRCFLLQDKWKARGDEDNFIKKKETTAKQPFATTQQIQSIKETRKKCYVMWPSQTNDNNLLRAVASTVASERDACSSRHEKWKRLVSANLNEASFSTQKEIKNMRNFFPKNYWTSSGRKSRDEPDDSSNVYQQDRQNRCHARATLVLKLRINNNADEPRLSRFFS
jgi:hypothetical protein